MNNYKMDANMQQIMLEAERGYQSRAIKPSGSPGQQQTDPHLDSIIYYEHPDTPRRRKKIFEPRYKDTQHNRHMNRLQSQGTIMKTTSVDAHDRISQLNQNFMGVSKQSPQVPTSMGMFNPSVPTPDRNIGDSATKANLDQQAINLFATALQQQPQQPHQPNPLQAHPQENHVAEAFFTQVNNQPQTQPDPLINMMAGIVLGDMARQNAAFPSQQLPSLVEQIMPATAPNIPSAHPISALPSSSQLDITNQNRFNMHAPAIQSRFPSDNAIGGMHHQQSMETAEKNMVVNLAGAYQPDRAHYNQQTPVNDAATRSPPSMTPMTHQALPNQNFEAFGAAFQPQILNRMGTNQTIPSPWNPSNVAANYQSQQQISDQHPYSTGIVQAAIHQTIRQSNHQSNPPQLPPPPPIRMVNSTDFHHEMNQTNQSHKQVESIQSIPPQQSNNFIQHPRAFEGAIRRDHGQQHSQGLVINQPNTTLHQNNVFNNTASINHGTPAPGSVISGAESAKDPQVTANMIRKITDIQSQIDKLSVQLRETEIKDSIREQRLQSVLSAKQKQVSRREAEMKKSEMLLMQMKEEKNQRAAHIESLKLEVERLRRENQLRRRQDPIDRGQLFQSFGKDFSTATKELGSKSQLPGELPRSDYSWASDRLVNSMANRGRIHTEVGSDRLTHNQRIIGGKYQPRSRQPSPENYSIIEKVGSLNRPDSVMVRSVPENLFTNALHPNSQQAVRVPVTPIMAQAPIKTITTMTPVTNYRALDTVIVPPLVIAPNRIPPSVTTVYQEHPPFTIHNRQLAGDSYPSFIRSPPAPVYDRGTFGTPPVQQQPQATILIQDREQ